MSGLKELIIFSGRNTRTLLAFLVLNLVVASIVIPGKLEKRHEAAVRLVFNKLDTKVADNGAADHLFRIYPNPNHSEYLGLLQSDTLIVKTVKQFNLVNHYRLNEDNSNSLAKAQWILRKRLSFLQDEHILTVKLVDEDEAIAVSALHYLNAQVKMLNATRIRQNNAITKKLLEQKIATLDQKIESLHGQLDGLAGSNRSIREKAESDILVINYRQSLTKKIELQSTLDQIVIGEKVPAYEPYSIVNMGASNITINPIVIFLLSLFALVVILAFEMQIAFVSVQISNILKKHSWRSAKRRIDA